MIAPVINVILAVRVAVGVAIFAVRLDRVVQKEPKDPKDAPDHVVILVRGVILVLLVQLEEPDQSVQVEELDQSVQVEELGLLAQLGQLDQLAHKELLV